LLTSSKLKLIPSHNLHDCQKDFYWKSNRKQILKKTIVQLLLKLNLRIHEQICNPSSLFTMMLRDLQVALTCFLTLGCIDTCKQKHCT
jgi:hypothetical protein